jgi:hypothetical protein
MFTGTLVHMTRGNEDGGGSGGSGGTGDPNDTIGACRRVAQIVVMKCCG